MSFPSAVLSLREQGINPEQATEDQAKVALLHAARNDLAPAFIASKAFAEVVVGQVASDPVYHIKTRLEECGHGEHVDSVLRSEVVDGALFIDYDPNSKLGGMVARLMTDAMRPVIEEHLGIEIGFYNCCKTGSGQGNGGRPKVSAFWQVNWQRSIDC